MVRFPMHGFAKRVDDTLLRAMTILRAKEGLTTAIGDSRLKQPQALPDSGKP
ncbi:hypothetical protein [Microvirga subterranea]|uniref:Uncharacterized protein n=1 Tax=Microvirga subterranea TaxID=186651 RepID=A0A370HCF2_9HYPH|nr:hypothetical protein [Microvirga subterranea]RDI52543.1 hypothetical protein DES45_1144 [Microvirga subterranea]